jgi:hypothetical protein
LASSRAGKEAIRDGKYKSRVALQEAPLKDDDMGADIVVTEPAQEAGVGEEKSGDKPQDYGKSYATRFQVIRRQPKRSKHQRPKRR